MLAPSKYQHMAAQSLNIGTRVLLLLPLSISLCQPREGAVPSCQCNLVTHDWPLWHYARHALMVMQLHVHVHDLHVWPPHACHEIVAFWECNYYLHWIRQVKPFRCFSKFFPWRNKCHFDRDICIKLKEIVMCHSFAAVWVRCFFVFFLWTASYSDSDAPCPELIKYENKIFIAN